MTPDLGADAPCLLSGIDNHRDLHAPTDRRPDLSTRATIHDLVIRFYREIVFDDLLAPVFDEVAEVDWTIHIPNLIDYWCWIVLGTNRHPRFGHRHPSAPPLPPGAGTGSLRPLVPALVLDDRRQLDRALRREGKDACGGAHGWHGQARVRV